MLPQAIESQINGLREGLAGHGWNVVSTEQPFEHEWWAAEFWAIESVWSPLGVRVVLTFVVDPMARESVWAVYASSKRPHHRPAGDAPSMTLKHGWQQQLAPFIAAVGRFRHPDPEPPAKGLTS